ncbi:response regulator transcription factor [Ravibacter arvi]|uniref:Response regulator transcription factor n=1 Tax=Ravibacter arvi TaxID=2051041 RepID=A0ABP8M8Y8_9BACT
MKHVLLVEDDRRIAQNISKGLRGEGLSVEVAFDGITGKQWALEKTFDLVLLDLNLPGLKGYDVCRQIRLYKPLLPVIMLTAYGEIEDKVEGLGLGADDYIVKPFDFRELIARIQSVLRRSDSLPGQRPHADLQAGDLYLNTSTKQVRRGEQEIELTAREFSLLEYLMRHRGEVVSKMDLAENVWHLNFDPGTNVVEVYINYLRRKVDRDFERKMIHTRPGLGYILQVDDVITG